MCLFDISAATRKNDASESILSKLFEQILHLKLKPKSYGRLSRFFSANSEVCLQPYQSIKVKGETQRKEVKSFYHCMKSSDMKS